MTSRDRNHPSQVSDIGRRLRRLRKERRLTQADLARQIGIQQSDLSRMEKGEYRVSLDNLFKLLGVFGVKASEFFAGEKASSPAPAPLQHRDMQLLQLLRQMSPEAREEVQEFAEFKLRREQAERRKLENDRQQESQG